MNTPEQKEELRQQIKSSSSGVLCAVRLAEISVDTSYSGFEDPRAAAHERLAVRLGGSCARGSCEVAVKIDIMNDTFSVSGICGARALREIEGLDPDYCQQVLWQEYIDLEGSDPIRSRELYKQIMEKGDSFANRYAAGEYCPQLDCDFNSGSSIDGYPGSSGQCQKQKEAQTGPPHSETSVTITPAQQ